jgi:hypothetical protein
MFARRAASLAVFSAVLVLGSAAYADFTAALYFTDAGGNPVGGLLEVADTQPTIELVLWDNQVYGGAGADFIQWVHLNFSASDVAALNPVAHWTWDPGLLGQLDTDGGVGVANAIGKQDGKPDVLWRPASPVRIGSLSIPTPALLPGGNNDHLLSLKGGDFAQGTVTFVMADMTAVAAESFGTMTLQDLTIRVAPEPATIALVGLGAAMALLRRKRA